ncbi:DUF4387 domain-containing protein [Umezawaea endophytica]|uniref:DUF4387 domain-containing protein n=1 Tax=Umezawaea endophytica TaxID=1654476 RepID=A0A9X2VKD0_9PSEU|nr:DUF4387 domain-containing protein [Umezawaea endophytica]MCS7477682.1 DUF4387 domain-containing protein [Umezawaea endophytica]
MPKLSEVTRHVRSKAAGPFWVSVDVMFDGQENFDRYSASPALSAESIAAVYGVDAATVSLYPIPALKVLKVSYPRKSPQGGVEERDMHSGQQYTYLLDTEL